MTSTFNAYTRTLYNRYYEGGVSSVYCWEVDGGFAACILIKKTQDQSKKGQPMKGAWDSIHVMEVSDSGRSAHYKLTSTVMLSLITENQATGKVNLAGSLTRQEERDAPLNEANTHIVSLPFSLFLPLSSYFPYVFSLSSICIFFPFVYFSFSQFSPFRNYSTNICSSLHNTILSFPLSSLSAHTKLCCVSSVDVLARAGQHGQDD